MKAPHSLLRNLPQAAITSLVSRLAAWTCLCLIVIAPQTSQAAPTTTTFAYTGADQSYVVPAGVTSITVKLWGAGGGSSGGSGAFVSGQLTVTPGETLTIITGGGGANALPLTAYGGGGKGTGGNTNTAGGCGGGRSAIRRATAELVTAGAGAGGRGNNSYGGAGGLTAGGTGPGIGGGAGGTQSSGNAQFAGGDSVVPGGYGGGGGSGYWGGYAGTTSGGGGGSSFITNLSSFSGAAGKVGTFNRVTPGGTTDPSYIAGVGSGGGRANPGGDGLVVITSEDPTPTVTAISPPNGPIAGGTPVTLTGTNFTGATGVTIGGVAATSVSVTSATTLTCVAPAGTAGAASVVVTTSFGANAANTLFTYINPAFTFNSATDVPLTMPRFTASGSNASFTLNYAPVTGASLMVVKNTGLSFISGTFGNLAHGQAVALSYGGATYNFVANYYGGTGNDLVLQWAGTRVYAWGWNDNGQLGNNSLTNSSVPVAVDMSGVLAGKHVIALARGGLHSLALCSDGTLAAWGLGQLGNGGAQSNVPVAVDRTGVLAGKTVISIAASESENLALCSDGTLARWGSNTNNVPVTMPATGALAGKIVVAISMGATHSLALCSDGTLAGWGDNTFGQLGNNSFSSSTVPVAVVQTGVLAGKTVIAIAGGSSFSLALCSDGTVAAWGNNSFGQLGNNSTAQSSMPVAVNTSGVLAGKTVDAIAAGYRNSLALCSDGTVAAWGDNTYGQLGNNSTTDSRVPAAVVRTGVLAGKTVIAVMAATAACHALCSDGTLAAWGTNGLGTLGNNGSPSSSTVPVLVSTTPLAAGDRFAAIAHGAGLDHALALVASAPAISPPPTVTGISPITGSAAGGTSVTITGTNFAGATGVTIGGAAATSVTVVDTTTLTCTTPAGTAGAASVLVTTPGGTNAANTLFTYVVPNTAPVITSNGGGASASISIPENTTAVTTVTATDAEVPATQTLSFSKSGADAALFNLHGGTGVLSFATSCDFEVFSDADLNGVYEVTVTATDNGVGLFSDSQALSITVTNGNELPSFTKGADQSVAVGTSAAQSVTGWATALNDGDSTVTQALSFTITGNTNAGLFSVPPTISNSGELAYTPAGTLGEATITVTLSDDTSIDGSALTTASQSFQIRVVSVYQQWAGTNTVSSTVTTADDDSDGITNLAEFAFGTNPQAGGSGPTKLAYSGTLAGGGNIATTGQPDVAYEPSATGVDYRGLFVRRKDHATAGLTYTAQFSATLGVWQTTTVTPTILADDGVHQIVSVPYMSFIQGRKVKFFRVQVALSP